MPLPCGLLDTLLLLGVLCRLPIVMALLLGLLLVLLIVVVLLLGCLLLLLVLLLLIVMALLLGLVVAAVSVGSAAGHAAADCYGSAVGPVVAAVSAGSAAGHAVVAVAEHAAAAPEHVAAAVLAWLPLVRAVRRQEQWFQETETGLPFRDLQMLSLILPTTS